MKISQITRTNRLRFFLLSTIVLLLALTVQSTSAQPATEENNAGPEVIDEATAVKQANQELAANAEEGEKTLSLVTLILSGGRTMAAIGLLSVIVVTLAFERAFALRRSHVIPPRLVNELDRLQEHKQGLNPKDAYQVCDQYPSAMANVVRAMLLRIGRPQSEVEHAVSEASEREAEQMYNNVRWITLAAGIAPLLGLLGTVWGIIWAFYETTKLDIGANRADQLAGGIYVALVTTLGGLAVAIPAAILAQYFESRIIKLFHQIDEELFDLLPSIERYEGKMRTSHGSLSNMDEPAGDEDKKSVTPQLGNL
ncbi:MAG: tolQ-type transporter [Blastopirellula sp.]|nr:MAG: tolQ-type transporter [Blastopirellula sp.]